MWILYIDVNEFVFFMDGTFNFDAFWFYNFFLILTKPKSICTLGRVFPRKNFLVGARGLNSRRFLFCQISFPCIICVLRPPSVTVLARCNRWWSSFMCLGYGMAQSSINMVSWVLSWIWNIFVGHTRRILNWFIFYCCSSNSNFPRGSVQITCTPLYLAIKLCTVMCN